jgi:hypothetical protein
MEREMSPGYEPWGEQGSRLIDPQACPDGHPWGSGGWQRSFSPCRDHAGHPSWRCHCGRWQYLREDGEIVETLACVEPNYGQRPVSGR